MSTTDPRPLLEALYPPDCPGWLVVFALPWSGASWYRPGHVGRIVARTQALARQANAYFGVALHERPLGPNHKGGKGTVCALPALWADCDVNTPKKAAKGHHYPPDVRTLAALLRRLPVRPSALVATGGGLHAYWLLREPWLLASPEDRDRATRLAKGWQATIRGLLAGAGYEFDETANLDRVLRLPGTVNWNTEPRPARVALVALDERRRYNPSDFEEWLPAAAPAPPVAVRPPRRISREGASLIDAYDQAIPVAEILARHGYERRGRDRWLAPQSSSGVPGVVVLENGRVYSHHAADPLATGHAHDAFSLSVILEHDGDARAAVRAAADELGLERGRRTARRGTP